MGVTDRISARAVRRAHVLAVEVPGWWVARAEVERAARARGWQLATSPADADVLAVCGPPGERLAAAVERVWQQLPGPRARVEVDGSDAGTAAAALGRAAQLLRTSGATDTPPDHTPPGDGTGDDTTGEHGPDEHDHEHGDMDMDMDMAPAGIPLAQGADDRDGLEMDVLAVPLGPVLPCWPGGLVLRCRLHGDVVAEAAVEVLRAAGPPVDTTRRDGASTGSARRLDAAAALLELAGWEDAAAAARRVRDRWLGGERAGSVGAGDERLHRRVARSRPLRWALPDDVRQRLLSMLDPSSVGAPVGVPLHALPGLVAGLDLAAVRLVVASLALDLSPAPSRPTAAADV